MCFTGHTPGVVLAACYYEAATLCFTGHTPGSYLLEVQPLNEADGRAIDGAARDYEAAALCYATPHPRILLT